jgi:SAM-dependent methyltransferase
MPILLHSSGVKVTGIDSHVGYRWGLGFRPTRYSSYLREAGLLRTLRKALGELVYDRLYYRTLAQAAGLSLTEEGLDLQEMTAEKLEFKDDSFDVIHSNATWEHLGEPGIVNQQAARVLRAGGLAYIEIHLFPSLSGGHELPWIVPGRTELGQVIPWQHLRDPDWRGPVFLNRLRERDYLRLFEETPGLEMLDWKTEFTEGADLLSSEILDELPDYPPEELTKRSIIAVLRKHV